MKWKEVMLTAFIAVAPVLSLLSTLPLNAAPSRPRIYVDPKDNIFHVKSTPAASKFTISIRAADWVSPGVYGYQVILHFNNTLLEAISAEYPKGHWFEPPFPVFDGGPPIIDNQRGIVTASWASLDGIARTGGGTLFTATFKIVETPSENETLSCELELKDVLMINPEAEIIPSDQYDVVRGNYLISSGSPAIREDVNHDGRVNIIEMALVALAWLSHAGQSHWNSLVDFNGDGQIDIIDATLVAKAWTW